MVTKLHDDATDSGGGGAAVNQVLAVLADEGCRQCIWCLMDREDVVGLETVIAAMDLPGSFDPRLEHHHRILPRLEREGYIEYDADHNIIEYEPDPLLEKYAPLVEEDLGRRDPPG